MSLPQTMTAIRAERGEAGVRLVPAQIAVPQPGPGQVLFKVAAGGVNRADLLQVQGHHPPPPGAPDTPGLEASGTVVAVGAGVSGSRVGDNICALLPGGGYAQYAIATEACILPVPKNVSLRDAGGIPEVYFTVWSNVFIGAALAEGETFLVHGGAGGIQAHVVAVNHVAGSGIDAGVRKSVGGQDIAFRGVVDAITSHRDDASEAAECVDDFQFLFGCRPCKDAQPRVQSKHQFILAKAREIAAQQNLTLIRGVQDSRLPRDRFGRVGVVACHQNHINARLAAGMDCRRHVVAQRVA